MNLLGVADTNCRFALTDIGALGREYDSSVFVLQGLEGRLVLET
jgi:hypothetical protein